MSPEDAYRIGELAVANRFADADGAFVAGSILRGEGTAHSDIDLVVLYERLPSAWRESFLVERTPVEAFVHDSETLPWFVEKETDAGRSTMLGMLAEGHIIGPRRATAEFWQAEARSRLAVGPPPLSQLRLDDLRYQITNLIDDLRDPRGPAETAAIASALFEPLAELLLRTRGTWSGRGKWIPRLLHRLDAHLALRFEQAFDGLLRHDDARSLIGFTETALRPLGGWLWDGYRRDAPPRARRAETDEKAAKAIDRIDRKTSGEAT